MVSMQKPSEVWITEISMWAAQALAAVPFFALQRVRFEIMIEGPLELLGVDLVFTWGAAVLAAAVVGFPLLVRACEQAFAEMSEFEGTVCYVTTGFHVDPHLQELLDVWMSHGDRVEELPPGFKVIAATEVIGLVME